MAFERCERALVFYDQETERFAVIEPGDRSDPDRMFVVSLSALAAPVCIGCGCSGFDACAVIGEEVGVCSWLAADEEVGVCSSCREHLDRWKRGELTIQQPPPEGDEGAATADQRRGLREQSAGGATDPRQGDPATARSAPREHDVEARTSFAVDADAGFVRLTSKAATDSHEHEIVHRMRVAEALILARDLEITADTVDATTEPAPGETVHG